MVPLKQPTFGDDVDPSAEQGCEFVDQVGLVEE